MKRSAPRTKLVTLRFYVQPDEADDIRRAARFLRQSLSAFVGRSALDIARRIAQKPATTTAAGPES